MLYAKVFKNEELLVEGRYNSAKKFTEEYPSQYVYVINEKTGEEELYEHNDENKVYFILYDEEGVRYNSIEKIDHAEIRMQQYLAETTVCPTCGNEKATRGELSWVFDNYGNPFKKCCRKCLAETERYISGWKFDESYAGECLE